MTLNEAIKELETSPWKVFTDSCKNHRLYMEEDRIVLITKEGEIVQDFSLGIQLIMEDWMEVSSSLTFKEAVLEYLNGTYGFWFINANTIKCHQITSLPLGTFMEGPFGFTKKDIETGKFYPIKTRKEFEEILQEPVTAYRKAPYFSPSNPLFYESFSTPPKLMEKCTEHMHSILKSPIWD